MWCLPAGSRLYITVHHESQDDDYDVSVELTFTIVSFGPLFLPVVMTKRRSSFSPAWRLRRKERYLGVVFSSDSPSSLACSAPPAPSCPCAAPPSLIPASRVAQQRSFRFREGRKIAPLLLPLEPVEYIACEVRLWKSRARARPRASTRARI